MRKRCFFVLFLVILASAFSFSGIAEEEQPFLIKIGEAQGNVGETVRVDVYIFDNPGIISINAKLNYDESIMKLTAVEDGGILGDEIKHQDKYSSPYSLSWANYPTNQATRQVFDENGKLCTLVFKLVSGQTDEVSPISLSLEKYSVMDFDLNDIKTETVSGNIKILTGAENNSTVSVVLIILGLLIIGTSVYFYYRNVLNKKSDKK